MTLTSKILWIALLWLSGGCGLGPDQQQDTQVTSFAHKDHAAFGYKVEHSMLILTPGSIVAICNKTEIKEVGTIFKKAVQAWFIGARRIDHIVLKMGCVGDRVVKLTPANAETIDAAKINFVAFAHPLRNNVNLIELNNDSHPIEALEEKTAVHETGHIFGFAHVSGRTLSVMNVDNFKFSEHYLNGGLLSDFDRHEIANLLTLPHFAAVNRLWQSVNNNR